MIFGLCDRDRLAELVAAADQRADFELVVETPTGPELRLGGLGLELAERPRKAVPARAQRRTAAVVADRHPLVVRQQRLVGAKQLADRRRVMNAGVEVGVVADAARHAHLGLRLRDEARSQRRGLFAAVAQRLRQGRTNRASIGMAARHERVEVALRQRHERIARRITPGAARAGPTQVEHLVADGHADAPSLVAAGAAKAPIGKVLQREVARRIVGRGDPALQRGVVSRVDRAH